MKFFVRHFLLFYCRSEVAIRGAVLELVPRRWLQTSDPLRQRWRRRGIKPCIPRRRNRKPNLEGYSRRWIVERTFSRLGNFLRLVVRWERHAHIYLAFLLIACAVISLRFISG